MSLTSIIAAFGYAIGYGLTIHGLVSLADHLGQEIVTAHVVVIGGTEIIGGIVLLAGILAVTGGYL